MQERLAVGSPRPAGAHTRLPRHRGRRRAWHADEVPLVAAHGALNIESRQTHGCGGEEHETGRPPEPAERRQPPRERQDGRRNSERDDIGQRIELDAESARGAGEAGDAAVEHVEHDRKTDERCGRLVLPLHRVDNAGVAAEHVAQGEQAGQQVHAAAQAPSRRIRRPSQEPETSFFSLQHDCCRQCNTAITVSPPRTVSPTFTAIVALTGRYTSIREPNFMMPNRSPACTSAPASTRHTTRRARMPTS